MAPTPWLKPKPTTTPDDSYTRAIAQGGLGAVQQARQQLRYGVGGMQQNYADTGVAAYQRPVQHESNMFDDWLAQTAPAANTTGTYGYGRGDGKYSGFETEGALKAAVLGRTDQLRGQDRDRFSALDYLANQGLDQTETMYQSSVDESKKYQAGMAPERADAQTKVDQFFPGQTLDQYARPTVEKGWLATGVAGKADQIVDAVTQATTGRTQQPPMIYAPEGLDLLAGPQEDRAGAAQHANYLGSELKPWLAQEAMPLLEQQQFAQSGLALPIAHYAQQAGAEYSVDPNIVGGWYDETSTLNDARDQRELEMLAETGMTTEDYMQSLNALESQGEEQADEQMTSQMSAQEQAIDDYGFQATGGVVGTTQLASQVGIQPMDVISILDSDAFQTYSADIASALESRNATVVADTMAQVLDDAAYTDPALLNVLQVVFKDYIPPDYEFLGA